MSFQKILDPEQRHEISFGVTC